MKQLEFKNLTWTILNFNYVPARDFLVASSNHECYSFDVEPFKSCIVDPTTKN